MRRLLLLLPLALLLAACAGTPVPERTEVPDARVAERQLAAGEFEAAARSWLQLASQAEPDRAAGYRLDAAEAWLHADRLDEAAALIDALAGRVPVELERRFRTLAARVALARNQPDQVLRHMARPTAADAEGIAEYHSLRADAYDLLGNHLEAARERIEAEAYLPPEAVLANQQRIWQSLSKLTLPALDMLASPLPRGTLRGWMELTAIGKQFQLPADEMRMLIAEWRRDNPDHVAREAFVDALLQRNREMVHASSRIALLLPLTGRFAQAAAAVRDGFMAAYYAEGATEGRGVRIYDVGETPAQLVDAYERAIGEGVDAVVGPLSKAHVAGLTTRTEFPVPTLALNFSDGPSRTKNLYQFSLAPEDEAQQVAERAWLAGYSRALVLVPATEWGRRIHEAFVSRWGQFGGAVAAETFYDPQQNDFSSELTAMLNLDQSTARNRAVRRALGRTVEFTPRRRQDVDFVFLAAFPRQARLIRPQLKFHHAADLPVYGTSHLYSGTPSPNQDLDMDGTLFVDMPWVVDGEAIPQPLRQAGDILAEDNEVRRLVALGIDAYRVLPMLRVLEHYPHERLDGVTGTLRLDEDRRIRRQLLWARIRNGLPRVIREDEGVMAP